MVGKLSGVDVTGRAALLYTLGDGLIAGLDLFADREQALRGAAPDTSLRELPEPQGAAWALAVARAVPRVWLIRRQATYVHMPV
jgi:hypothetical protein